MADIPAPQPPDSSPGTVAVNADGNVAMVDPGGTLVYVSQDEAQKAIDSGFRLPTQAESQEVGQREKYGQGLGNELRAGVEGAARGLTFGLSDVALGALDQEGTREREERNPMSAGLGEAAGVGAGLLATGGASGAAGAGVRGVAELGELAAAGTSSRLLARGIGGLGEFATAGKLGVAGAGVRGVAGLGELAAHGAEHLIAPLAGESLLRTAAAKGLARGFGGAVEGAIYGGGQAVSEAALGQSEDLSQALMAHVGLGALVGGGVAGGLGFLGSISDTGTRSIARTLGLSKEAPGAEAATISATEGEAGATPPPSPTAEPSVAEAAPASPFAERAAKTAAKVGHIVSGADESTLADLVRLDQAGAEFRHAAFSSQPDVDKAAREMADSITANESAAREINQESLGSLKFEKVKALVDKDNLPQQLDTASMLFSKARDLVKQAQDEPTILKSNWQKLGSLTDGFEKKVQKAIASGEDVGAKTFIALDEMKRALGPLAKPGQFASEGSGKFALAVRDLYTSDFRAELESQQVWGEKAAELQRRQNKAWTDYLSNKRQFDEHFMTKTGERGFNPIYEADGGKIEGFLKNLNSVRNDIPQRHLLQHIETQETLAKEIRDLYDLAPEKVADMQARNAQLKKTVSDISHDTSIKNKVAKVAETKTGRATVEAMKFYASVEKGIADRFGRGPLAGAKMAAENPEAYAAAKRMAARQQQAANLAGVEKANQKVNQGIETGINSYFERFGKVAKGAVTPAAVGAVHRIAFRPGEQKKEASHTAYKKRLGELAELTQNPDHLLATLQKNIGALQAAAPQIGGQLHFSATQALSFLYSKAPKDPLAASLINPRMSTWKPSDSELATFERYLHTAENPLSILDELKQGTLTPEAVETVRALYPSLMDKITRAMLPRLSEKESPIPYQQRLHLSTLFGVPTDGSMDPKFWTMMQDMHAATTPKAGPQNPARASKNSRAEQIQTPLQRSISRT